MAIVVRDDKTGGFSSEDRLRKRSEFLAVTREGRKIRNGGFILFYRPGRYNHPRLGVTVSKRVGNAVVRNLLKRRIREYFRRNRSLLTADWDINVIARPAAARMTASETAVELNRLFSAIKAESSLNSFC